MAENASLGNLEVNQLAILAEHFLGLQDGPEKKKFISKELGLRGPCSNYFHFPKQLK